jgi:AMMECR1 domain-containing protein
MRVRLSPLSVQAVLVDPRFRISLLTDFEDAEDWQDWTVGTHGIHIWFPHPRSASTTLSATYLPQVMPEQGWTKQEAIDSAVHKAGWEGQVTEGIRQSIRLERYQSRKCTVGWDDYVRWRQAHGESVNV